MTVHLFGATSSPGVDAFGPRKLASDYEHVSSKAAKFLWRHYYVDDGLISVSTTQETKSLIQRAVEICGKANLRYFSENNTGMVYLFLVYTISVLLHPMLLSHLLNRNSPLH